MNKPKRTKVDATARWGRAKLLCAAVSVAVPFLACTFNHTADLVEPPQSHYTSIAYLKSLYRGRPLTITDDIVVKGWVVSSDRCGNFYKSICIEDSTAGIEIRIDCERLFERYYVGDSLVVVCSGLTVGGYGRLVQLGGAPSEGFETSCLTTAQADAHIAVSGHLPSAPQPQTALIGNLSTDLLCCYVRFERVGFAQQCAGMTWAERDSAAVRQLCNFGGDTLDVYTSQYATFALKTLPVGELSVAGILSFFNNRYQLRVVDPYDVSVFEQ